MDNNNNESFSHIPPFSELFKLFTNFNWTSFYASFKKFLCGLGV